MIVVHLRTTLSLGVLLLGTSILPECLPGQVLFDVGPVVGVYVPIGSFGSAPVLTPIGELSSVSQQKTAASVGAQGTVWLGSHFGVSAQWSTTASAVRTRQELGAERTEQSARVDAAAVQLLLPLRVPSLQGRVHLGAGVGVVRRRGDFYEGYEDTRDFAGVLSLGSVFALSRPVQVMIDFGSYLYSLRLGQQGRPEFDSGFQADLLARAGVLLRLEP
jgi:hypothetical protein